MKTAFSIRVYKQYFNFASSHFMLFKDGSREPLHGHNYRVQVKGNAPELDDDMVFDFLNIKPIIRKICDSLDHKLLIPKLNTSLVIEDREKNYQIVTRDESMFSIPKTDVLLLPIENTSAERIAAYIGIEIKNAVFEQYKFKFSELEIEVEETPGQSAVVTFLKD
jgi:6-pyruvoyltetrahydropterin/6-carboxytetrahydropterin synthase